MGFTVALAEDNRVNKNTFLQKLQAYPALHLVFTADNGHHFLQQLQGLPHNKLPQVVFMDLEMPQMDGIEAIRIAKSQYQHLHFIVLTVFDDDEKIFEAIRAGASGYLLKHEPATMLWESVVNVMESGGAPMSPAIARKALTLLSKSGPVQSAAAASQMPGTITDREKQILQMMVNGWDAKRIATELDVSVLTVRKHIANIYEKLQVNSKAQVISLAHKNKWV
jgi:DNA-binding NarL/FixJ family response regulator